jgi:4-hydroxybenzoate polyprenyltransferase
LDKVVPGLPEAGATASEGSAAESQQAKSAELLSPTAEAAEPALPGRRRSAPSGGSALREAKSVVGAPCSQAGAAEPALPGRRRSAPSGGSALREAKSVGALYLDLIRWNRPAGWLLLLWPTLSALWVAANGFPGWHLVTVFTLGTFLMRSAGCCLNDVADRDFDRHVKRTAQRPVTSGKVSPAQALLLGAVLALLAFGLVLTTNAAAIAWSFAALAVTLVYPFAKRHVAMPQAVLGVAFSFGIPMAFAAVQGGDSWSWSALRSAVPPLAWVLLLGNLFWVVAYDTEYAMVDRDDDLRIGMKTSAITLGRFDVAAVMLCYLIFLSIWGVALAEWAQSAIYFVALALALLQALWHVWMIRKREREGCFRAFRLNHWLGLTVFAGIVLSSL